MASTSTQEACSLSTPEWSYESSMASTSTQEACPLSRTGWSYDVFISFCGKDTRRSFTGHLFAALEQRGIIVFRDDEKLERGKYVSEELMRGIQESQFAVVVISENYASSKWCLLELTKIVECMRKTRLTVLPVFYEVDPSDVRNQKGIFAEAFERHTNTPKAVGEKWRAALNKVGHLAGWHVHNREEIIIIEEICKKILGGLHHNLSYISKDLVGITSKVKKMINLLCLGCEDVRFIGICGMGGIGKTTLAKVIFHQVSAEFEASCFIDNVKEQTRNLVHLQKQIISQVLRESKIEIWNVDHGTSIIGNRIQNKKVLIVLDDVDGEEQLKALASSGHWFGLGSRIIITSRDRHLLTTMKYDLCHTYDVELLNYDDALKLFSWKAFKKPYPKENYAKLSEEIVNHARGLPLALEIFGSFLFGRTVNAWRSARDLLKVNLNAPILNKLRISFDALEDLQKDLFLDIACFFNGKDVNDVFQKLESFGYCPDINIEVLKEKSLLKIEYGLFQMHDLLQQMGQQIVHHESRKEPGGRSRLWLHEDIVHILKYDTGTDAIEGIVLTLPLPRRERLNLEAFSKMKNLRMLEIIHKKGHHSSPNDVFEDLHILEWHGDPSNFILSDKLRFMKWWGCPLESLPTNFEPNNLVELTMPWSSIKLLWDKKKVFSKLKRIDLSNSQNLMKTPDFTSVPNLEELELSSCTSLFEIHPSIGFLEKLLRLRLAGCKSLERLPRFKRLSSLKDFDLNYCSKLKEIPESISCMKDLVRFGAKGIGIRQLPSSMISLNKLKELYVGCCPYEHGPNINSMLLVNSFSGLSSLYILDLSYCSLLDGALPDDLGCLSSLWSLDLSGNKLTKIPDSIYRCSDLKWLILRNCSELQELPKLPLDLANLVLENCPSLGTFYNQMEEWSLVELLLTGCSFLVDYFGYDIKPYKILYLHPRSFLWTFRWDKHTNYVLACGPTRGSEIPAWFNEISTNFSRTIECHCCTDVPETIECHGTDFQCHHTSFPETIECHLELDWGGLETGYALFVVYQVQEHVISNPEIVYKHNPTFPKFICQLQAREDGPRVSLAFCVPEIPSIGKNGVWVFIKASCFEKLQNNLHKFSYHRVSIAISSFNVEIKECKGRLVSWDDLPELDCSQSLVSHRGTFFEVLNSISSRSLDPESLKNYFSDWRCLCVEGPIKGHNCRESKRWPYPECEEYKTAEVKKWWARLVDEPYFSEVSKVPGSTHLNGLNSKSFENLYSLIHGCDPIKEGDWQDSKSSSETEGLENEGHDLKK